MQLPPHPRRLFNHSIEIVPIERLRPHEEIEPRRMRRLVQLMKAKGVWSHPLAIDRESGCVMDGHHRLAAAQILGLTELPCIRYSYGEITVESRRPDISVDGALIVQRAKAGELFPPRTTRHLLPPPVRCAVPLSRLTIAGRSRKDYPPG